MSVSGIESQMQAAEHDFKARVRLGALLLDRLRPEWFSEIDLDKLDLSHGECCVLGQLFDFESAYVNGFAYIAELLADYRGLSIFDDTIDGWFAGYGFFATGDDRDRYHLFSMDSLWALLTPLWMSEVRARIAKGK